MRYIKEYDSRPNCIDSLTKLLSNMKCINIYIYIPGVPGKQKHGITVN